MLKLKSQSCFEFFNDEDNEDIAPWYMLSLLKPVYCTSVIPNYISKRNFSLVSASAFAVGTVVFSFAIAAKSESRRRVKRIWYDERESIMPSFSTFLNDQYLRGIIAANAAVFFAWNSPFVPFMKSHFASSIINPPYTMLTSIFSHQGIIHLLFNMTTLYGLRHEIHEIFDKEEFYAFFVSAGTISSFASLVAKSLNYSWFYSIGASGSIAGLLAVISVVNPGLKASILFMPPTPISKLVQWALVLEAGCLVFGILPGIDHAGHIAGALFGYWYMKYGRFNLWVRRKEWLRRIGL